LKPKVLANFLEYVFESLDPTSFSSRAPSPSLFDLILHINQLEASGNSGDDFLDDLNLDLKKALIDLRNCKFGNQQDLSHQQTQEEN
jgi:hypothetical protein